MKTKAIKEIKHYLGGMSILGSAHADLLLKYGKAYHITPKTLEGKRGTESMCYMNAFKLADSNPNLIYVEGYVHIGFIAIEHAWCVDKKDNAIDPTLKKSSPAIMNPKGYFGIPFKHSYLIKTALDTGMYGIISHTNLPLLKGEIKPEEFLAA